MKESEQKTKIKARLRQQSDHEQILVNYSIPRFSENMSSVVKIFEYF